MSESAYAHRQARPAATLTPHSWVVVPDMNSSQSGTESRNPLLPVPGETIRLMEPTYFAQYRGYEFQCSPERVGDRGFAPRLVIHDSAEAWTVEIPLDAPIPPFTNPTVAAHRAFALGRRWVDGGYAAAEMAASARGPQLLNR